MQPKLSKRTGAKTKKQPKESTDNTEENVKYELNFFLLQEAARMDLTRSLDSLTTAIVECKSSVIVAANQDNFMHLIAHLRDPQMLTRSSIHNVPYTNTFLDYVRWENNDSRVTRYAWDQAVREANIATIQSFLRFQLKSMKRSTNAVSHTKVAAWEDDKSLIMDLISTVTTAVNGMKRHLLELRNYHVYLSFALWNKRSTIDSNDECVIFDDHHEMFVNFLSASSPKLFRRTGMVEFIEAPAKKAENHEYSEVEAETLRSECKAKLNEYIRLPYTYDLVKDFLNIDETYSNSTIPVSFGQKMTDLAICIKEAVHDLVRVQMFLHTH